MGLLAAIEMRDRQIDWPKSTPADDGSLFDIAKTGLTRSLSSFSKTSDWHGPATSGASRAASEAERQADFVSSAVARSP
jgi:hypothetical protein